jgi:hypothetical protein
MYRREDLAAVRASLEQAHRAPLAGLACENTSFSEFNILGAWCERHRPDRYRFIDTAIEQATPLPLAQHWSWGGLTLDVERRVRAILG